MSTVPTPARKEAERALELDKRPAWACRLVESSTGRQLGIMFKWLDGPWTGSPDDHFTDDGGRNYKRVSGSIFPPDLHFGEIETDPQKLTSLRRLMIAYLEQS